MYANDNMSFIHIQYTSRQTVGKKMKNVSISQVEEISIQFVPGATSEWNDGAFHNILH